MLFGSRGLGNKRYKLLDLFCGAGGAAMGYYHAGFEVIGVDIKPQPHYPFEFHQADALTYPLEGFDAYHASPPCQAYVDFNCNRISKHPKLIEPIRMLLQSTNRPFVIENVHKAPLKAQLMLCGTMFNLRVFRHRYFELSFSGPMSPFTCNHWGTICDGQFTGAYALGGKGHRHGKGIRDPKPIKPSFTKAEALGIEWAMTDYELNQAIPPAYTEFIGKYLMQVLELHGQ